jgi:hypothetical protein
MIQPSLVNLGLPARPRLRYYHADEVFWRVPQTRERIEGMILCQGLLSCVIFGRENVGGCDVGLVRPSGHPHPGHRRPLRV